MGATKPMYTNYVARISNETVSKLSTPAPTNQAVVSQTWQLGADAHGRGQQSARQYHE